MSELQYYVLDTETTGFSPGNHEMVEYSIINCSNRKQLSRIIKAEHPETASQEALQITGKTKIDLLKGISKEEAVKDLIEFINLDGNVPEGRVIIAHNAVFDMKFCHALFRKVKKSFPVVCWLDTKALAKDWFKKQGMIQPGVKLSLKLGDCIRQAGLKGVPTEHNAKADAQNAFILWFKAMEAGIDYLHHIKRVPCGIFEEEINEMDEPGGEL